MPFLLRAPYVAPYERNGGGGEAIVKTKAQALQAVADIVAEEVAIASKLTARGAAERAWHPGGPTVEELTRRIETDREEARENARRERRLRSGEHSE